MRFRDLKPYSLAFGIGFALLPFAYAEADRDLSCLRLETVSMMALNATSSTTAGNRVAYYEMLSKKIIPLKLAKLNYGADGESILKELSALGDDYERLVVDPGLVHHLADFKTFVNQLDAKPASPWIARHLFKSSLPKREVFRAMFLSPSEAKSIAESGVYPYVNLKGKGVFHWFDGFEKMIQDHMNDKMNGSQMVSVAEHSEISLAVANRYRDQSKENGKMYLVKISASELDLLSFGKYFQLGDHWVDRMKAGAQLHIHSKSGTRSYPIDGKMESFMHLGVAPSEILEMRVIPEAELPTYTFSGKSNPLDE